MNAWLLVWEGMTERMPDDKVLHVLPASKTVEEVAEIVELLYSQFNSNIGEMALYASDRGRNPYRAEIGRGGNAVSCGHNPWLEARRVQNLQIVNDPKTFNETISWTAVGSDQTQTFTRPDSGCVAYLKPFDK